MNGKERAAIEAISYIRNGMVVGLGSGSTSEYFINALGQAIRDGRLRDLRCVSTSISSDKLARSLGMTVITLKEAGIVDVTIDGADEIDPQLNLIKGLGGALVREKIIEQSSRRFICIADETKLVERLGIRCPLPVEVIPFCHDTHEAFFHSLGGTPRLRTNADASPYITDNGNYIYHLKFNEGIASAKDMDRKLRSRAGVVGTGLFLSMCDLALIGSDTTVRTLKH